MWDCILLEAVFSGWIGYHKMLNWDPIILQDDKDRVFNEIGVAEDMFDFLQEFFEGAYIYSQLLYRYFVMLFLTI